MSHPLTILRTGAAMALCLSLSSACAQQVDLTAGELEPGARAATITGNGDTQQVTTALVPTMAVSAAALNGGNQWLANRVGGVPVTHVTNPTGARMFVPMGSAVELASAERVLPTQGIAIAQGCPAQNVAACGQSISVGYGEVGWSNNLTISTGGSATVTCASSGDWTLTSSHCPVVAVTVSAPAPAPTSVCGAFAVERIAAAGIVGLTNVHTARNTTTANAAACTAWCGSMDAQACFYVLWTLSGQNSNELGPNHLANNCYAQVSAAGTNTVQSLVGQIEQQPCH